MNSWRLSGCAWPACLLVLCCLFFFVNVILIYLKHINRCRPLERGNLTRRRRVQKQLSNQVELSKCWKLLLLLDESLPWEQSFSVHLSKNSHEDSWRHTHTHKQISKSMTQDLSSAALEHFKMVMDGGGWVRGGINTKGQRLTFPHRPPGKECQGNDAATPLCH